MIWLVPAASIGLAALVVPLLVHLVARRTATRRPFPSLRFLQASTTRSRSLRPADPLLFAVRASIVAAAVAALAAPLILTRGRHDAWNARFARVAVVEDGSADVPLPADTAFRRTVRTTDLRLGVAQAAAWLSTVPPARREIVVRAAFSPGSIDGNTFAAIDPRIGVRLERDEGLPPRALVGPSLLFVTGGRRVVQTPRATMTAGGTAIEPVGDGPAPVPCRSTVTVSSPETTHVETEAALRSVLARGVPCASSTDRRIHLVFGGPALPAPEIAPLQPWMTATLAFLAPTVGDRALEAAAIDGRGGALRVPVPGSAATPRGLATIRAAFEAVARTPHNPPHEGGRLDAATLTAWSRPAGSAVVDAVRFERTSDGRWVWGVVLVLLIVEQHLRRRGATSAAELRSAA